MLLYQKFESGIFIFMKKNKNNKKGTVGGWKGCDDCAICRAMKSGEANSYEGLKKAFAEQNAKNMHMAMRVQDHNDLYYDAMDALSIDDYTTAAKLLLEAKEIDPDCVQTYVGLANVYGRSKDKKKASESIKTAFEKVLKEFPTWPKRMEWGDMDNRAYMRAIQYRADLYSDEGETEKAIELYKLLLRLNPDDNQGVRYVLAGVYAGIDGKEINSMFEKGNKKQDWNKLEKLVAAQNEKHSFWKRPKTY
jgi:tetratricopeptide (TPR) repeat protein